MRAALGVSCVCSNVPRAKSDRVRVENALCRSIRVPAHGAEEVRTVFWRTTGIISYLYEANPSEIKPKTYNWEVRLNQADSHTMM